MAAILFWFYLNFVFLGQLELTYGSVISGHLYKIISKSNGFTLLGVLQNFKAE